METAAFGFVKCFIYSQLSQITGFSFVCSIFNTVSEQSCSLVSGRGLKGQKGLSAVVWSQVKGGGVQHPCCSSFPKAPSLECCPTGVKSPPRAQLGLGCWCAQQDGHFPGTAMLPSTSAAGGSGNKRVCAFQDARWLLLPKSPSRSILHLGEHLQQRLPFQTASLSHARVARAPLFFLFPLTDQGCEVYSIIFWRLESGQV